MRLFPHRPDPTAWSPRSSRGRLPLDAGQRVAVIGGGPAGCFFAHTLLRISRRLHRPLDVDIHDPRGFGAVGPGACAHCGGIVSESLVQILASEGLRLPPRVVQRGIGAYVVHTDVGSVRIENARKEERIAALYRGGGPRGSESEEYPGLDQFLLERAVAGGAQHLPRLASRIVEDDELKWVEHPDGSRSGPYHLVAVASGINSQLVPLLHDDKTPERLRTYICEFRGTEELVEETLGHSMHVFLLDLPNLEFAAIIPKGAHVTLCILGEEIDHELIDRFLAQPQVQQCISGLNATRTCHCAPLMNVRSRAEPYADRVVFIGDAGVTRLYKDGIGAAFRTATAAAQTAALFGVSADDFRKHYRPICRSIQGDNRIGRFIFAGAVAFKKLPFLTHAMLHMVAREQEGDGPRRMSSALWNLFTGSAPYRTIIAESLHPGFFGSFAWSLIQANLRRTREVIRGEDAGAAVP